MPALSTLTAALRRPLAGRWGRPPRRDSVLLPGTPVHLTTSDDVDLAGVWVPGPPGLTLVVSHGMAHSIEQPATRRVIDGFARHGSVLAVDFRGHGGSGGRSSVGRDEPLDTDAAVALARSRSTDPIVLVGFSMGGAVALIQAVLGEHRPDAVVAVSPPSRWFIRQSPAMRRVHWILEHPLGPLAARWIGLRLSGPWHQVPPSPLEVIGRITVPALLVQGDADDYFTPDDGRLLATAAGGRAELWVEPRMRHAEAGTSAALIDRIAGWAADAAVGQQAPPPAPGRSGCCRN